MSDRVPTVRVAHPEAPGGYAIINAADLTDAHELWPEQADDYQPFAPPVGDEAAVGTRLLAKVLAARAHMTLVEWGALPASERLERMVEAEAEFDRQAAEYTPPRVGKGPGGRWYHYRGKERLEGSFDSEEAALAALQGLQD